MLRYSPCMIMMAILDAGFYFLTNLKTLFSKDAHMQFELKRPSNFRKEGFTIYGHGGHLG